MNNQFVITADICGHKYFLRFVDAALGWHLATYEGMKENATTFDNEELANTQLLTMISEFPLSIEPLSMAERLVLPRQPLHERIRELRKATFQSQEQVAAALQIQRGTYQSYEDGRGGPSLDTIIAIARYHGITVEELVKGKTIYIYQR